MKFAVAINLERFDPARRMDDVTREVLHFLQMADRGGFETAWAAEHHTIESIIGPNPLTTLVWWGQHTERIRLGAATIVAPYWNPIRLAGEAAMCDHLTGGRLELGLGRGAFQYEFDRMAGGIPQQEGVAYLKELLPAVRRLWAGDYAHEGHYWRFPLSTSVPKPKQQPEPPIWVAARDPGTYDWAIANGANILSTPLSSPPAEVLVLGERYRKAVADHPEVPRPRFMMQRRTCVYSRETEWEEVVRLSSDYGRRFENLFQNIGGVTNGFPEPIDTARVAGSANYDPQNVRRNLLFGTPEEIIEKIQIYEQAGVDQLSINISFGLPFEIQKTSLSLFIDEVMPAFATRSAANVAGQPQPVSAA
jgi:alkanesulfonate monooxygenase SsuD/methylene tetrahydromethanopterin reductase-like flavin-dependent oxidoreductase (luciferase family)